MPAATTLAEAPIIVPFPPKQVPSALIELIIQNDCKITYKAHKIGLTGKLVGCSASCNTTGIMAVA